MLFDWRLCCGTEKHKLELQEEQRRQAALIAIEAGAISACEIHEGVYVDSGDSESAYRLANHYFNVRDVLTDGFETRREMTDAIKSVLEDAGSTCAFCQKIFEDD